MANAITVPQRYSRGLAKIKSLSKQQAEDVAKALSKAHTGTRREMLSLVQPALQSFSREDVTALAETLRSLYSARTGMDTPVDQFVPLLVAAVRQSGYEEVHTEDPDELSRLESTLTSLLGVQPLSVMSKARDLQLDFANTFCDAKVITDMRPVFDVDVQRPPVGVVLTHTLKLEYHDVAGKHTEIHIALEKNEIERLMSVLRRAQQKENTLSEVAVKAGMPILGE